MPDKISKLVSLLFMSRTLSHVAHLRTTSIAKHLALNELYDEIIPLTDKFAECAQGKYGLLDITTTPDKGDVDDPIAMVESHVNMLQTLRKSVDENFLLNILDEIIALYYMVLYKLKYLS